MMLTYSQYRNAVLQQLQQSTTPEQYAESFENRLSVVEVIIMDEYDKPSIGRPIPEAVVEMLLEEFKPDES